MYLDCLGWIGVILVMFLVCECVFVALLRFDYPFVVGHNLLIYRVMFLFSQTCVRVLPEEVAELLSAGLENAHHSLGVVRWLRLVEDRVLEPPHVLRGLQDVVLESALAHFSSGL